MPLSSRSEITACDVKICCERKRIVVNKQAVTSRKTRHAKCGLFCLHNFIKNPASDLTQVMIFFCKLLIVADLVWSLAALREFLICFPRGMKNQTKRRNSEMSQSILSPFVLRNFKNPLTIFFRFEIFSRHQRNS